jgi:outer membrane protein TolC
MLTTLVGALLGGALAPAEVPPELLQGRYQEAKEAYRLTEALYKNGQGSAEEVVLWSRRLLDAERPLCKNKEDEIAAVQQHLDRMKELEKRAEQLVKAGAATRKDVSAARYHRFEAEILLSQLKGK